jgi:hypothetical protein
MTDVESILRRPCENLRTRCIHRHVRAHDDDLKARIAKTIDYVRGARPVAFAGAENRAILFPLIENLVFDSNGFEYLRDWALPHFYFHVVTAYDILRHNGVEIGKRDYLSHTGVHIHPRPKTLPAQKSRRTSLRREGRSG